MYNDRFALVEFSSLTIKGGGALVPSHSHNFKLFFSNILFPSKFSQANRTLKTASTVCFWPGPIFMIVST